jgi:hypothetical protein
MNNEPGGLDYKVDSGSDDRDHDGLVYPYSAFPFRPSFKSSCNRHARLRA